MIIADEEKDEHLCAYYDEDDCRFAFVYSYDEEEKVIIRTQEKRECPPQVLTKFLIEFYYLYYFNFFLIQGVHFGNCIGSNRRYSVDRFGFVAIVEDGYDNTRS